MKVETHYNICLHQIRVESVAKEDLMDALRFTADYIANEVRGEVVDIAVTDDHENRPMVQVFEWVGQGLS